MDFNQWVRPSLTQPFYLSMFTVEKLKPSASSGKNIRKNIKMTTENKKIFLDLEATLGITISRNFLRSRMLQPQALSFNSTHWPFVKTGQWAHLLTRYLPNTSRSIPLLENVFQASLGLPTIGSPRRLKLVFINTGTPVASPNFSTSR